MRELDHDLKSVCETLHVPAGERICVRGQSADAAYMIREGSVRVYRDDAGGDLARLGPGDIFGEMAVLRYGAYTMSVAALEDCELHVIPPDVLLRRVSETDPLVRAILNMALDRINDSNEVLVDIDRSERLTHSASPRAID